MHSTNEYTQGIGGGGSPDIYNGWCHCYVSAREVLAYKGEGQNQAFRAQAQIAMDNWLSEQMQGNWIKEAKNWFFDHLYAELSTTLTGGAQIAITPTPKGPVPAFIRGGPLGIKLNLASLVIHKEQFDSDKGRTQTFWTQGVITQGVGLSSGFGSIEWNRTIENQTATDIITLSLPNGAFGIDYNVQTGQIFIGAMPTGSIIFGLGVEAGGKFGIQFNLN